MRACYLLPSSTPVDDTLDSILAGSDEEEETEAIVGKVLDEIGIEMTSKVSWWEGGLCALTHMYWGSC